MNKYKGHIIIFFLFVFVEQLSFAQTYPRDYRSRDNSHYWKNRMPHEAYWQQDVDYVIKARINDQSDVLDGALRLVYHNNSPDVLPYVYFHLYQNAFLPNSYYHKMQIDNNQNLHFGSYQKMGLGTVVEEIIVDGVKHNWSEDNTIMRVLLDRPIESMDSAVFDIKFKTYFNADGRWGRMRLYERWGFKHFNGAHFYPRISVYDSKFGWTADQHLVHEFYGNFGSYYVELDLPENYILEATGVLVNEAEVLPDELKNKIDITNFKDKPFNSPPSVIIPYDSSKRKVWKYRALNVHDFAFVASPTYRLGEVERYGVRCVAIAHEPHASKWQNAAEMTSEIISIFNEKAGAYAYPKIVVADAFSGMEYPMLTMNSGFDPDYAYIFTHEIGHNWFYGMVGSNETYNAFIDEGFTQFLTVYGLEKLSEKYSIQSPPKCLLHRSFKRELPLLDRHAYLRYYRHAHTTSGTTLNTHSDMFDTNRPYGEEYRQTYYKGAVMLYNLKYVLGNELFDKALKDFYEKWKFCNPYAEDVRSSFIQSTNVDLNWFFDQFIETDKIIDYAVKSSKKKRNSDTHIIRFERKGAMQMPIDFTVVSKKDSLYHFHIPNTNFIKKTDAQILPKWYGWMHFNRLYDAEVSIPNGIKNVVIDTTLFLADVYMPDNSLKNKRQFYFDYLINQPVNRSHYEVYYRPDFWWNGVDGLKSGVNINSHYMNHYHILDFSVWYNTRIFQNTTIDNPGSISYSFNYNNPIGRYNKKSRIHLAGLFNNGFHKYALKTSYKLKNKEDHVYAEIASLVRNHDGNANLTLFPKEWDERINSLYPNFNNMLNLGYNMFYSNLQRRGSVDLRVGTSFILNPYDFSKITFKVINDEKIDLLRFKTRFFMQWTTGKSMPKESMLYLSGASPEELLDSKFTQAVGVFPADWGGFGPYVNYFHASGGLNVRGYAGYLAPQFDRHGNLIPSYKGHSGLSVNSELEFDNIFNIKPKLTRDFLKINSYFFADAGIINVGDLDEPIEFGALRASAGVGFAVNIIKWYCFDKAKPLTVRFDFPVFLNRPPAIDNQFFSYRWLIGINRAF